jgi:hypothetical protein
MSVVIPSLRAAIAVPSWAKNELWRRARAVPSLDLRFADNKSLVDAVTGASLVTFTRASDGMFVGSDGVLQTAATDVPRFDHNPTTGESLGLLVEEQRTNSVRNNTMVGAVAGTPGTLPTNWVGASLGIGISREIIGTGTANGIDYIDVKYSGTTTGSGVINLSPDDGVIASSGQAWTSSAYVTLLGGSTANLTLIHRIRQAALAGVFIAATDQTLSPVSGDLIKNRYSVTLSSAPATIASLGQYFLLSFAASGLAVDITLRIGLPQLEQGATASSVIPTTTAAVTRSADVASITGSAFSSWYQSGVGSLYGETISRSSGLLDAGGIGFGVAVFSDGTNDNRIRFGVTGTGTVWIAATNTEASLTVGTYTAGASFKLAAAYAVNDFAFTKDAATVQVDTSGVVPTVSQLSIGRSNVASGLLTGTIRRLCYWPTRLPDSTLQAVTQ